MRRKYANAPNLVEMEKEFSNKEIYEKFFRGNVSLLIFKKVDEPWVVTDYGKSDCILNTNYKWLEIYPENEKYAITAMYNDKGELVQYYFDTLKDMGIENGIPYIDDLYLDLVIKADGRMVVLDENELEAAYEVYDVSDEDFKLAYNTLENLKIKFGNNLKELSEYTSRLLKLFINNDEKLEE